jgi:hypothetical protein
MVDSESWIATTLLPLAAAAPGRLVTDITNPEQDFQDTSMSDDRPECPEAAVSETRAEGFINAVANSKSNSLSALLTTLLGPALNVRKEEVLVIAAKACKTRTLSNSTNYFLQASKSSIVRDWLEQVWREGKKAYLMAGIKTILDAQITLQLAKSKEVAFQTKLPGSIILTAATQGIIPTLGGLETILDSKVSTAHEKAGSSLSSYIMPGEHIVAIQYRKVDFAWFRRGPFNVPGLKEATFGKFMLAEEVEKSEKMAEVMGMNRVLQEVMAKNMKKMTRRFSIYR